MAETPLVTLTKIKQVQDLIADLYAAARWSAQRAGVRLVVVEDAYGAKVQIEVNLKGASQK